jgi:hypothetical protein
VSELARDAAEPFAVVADPDRELAVLPLAALDRLGRVHFADGVGRSRAVSVVLDVEIAGYWPATCA